MGFRFPEKPKLDTPDLFGMLWQVMDEILTKILTGVTTGLLAPFAHLAELMDWNWARLGNAEDKVILLEDGQLALNHRADLMSPLLDYGSAYAHGSEDLINTGVVPFNRQIGAMQNCYLADNSIVLEDQGVWDVRARTAYSWTAVPLGGDIDWRIEVLRPDGSLFHFTRDQTSEMTSTTREINTSVVVPDSGYRVRVRITALIAGRHTKGGPENNRLTVQHITRDTSHQIQE